MEVNIVADAWNMAESLRNLADYIDNADNLPSTFQYEDDNCEAAISM